MRCRLAPEVATRISGFRAAEQRNQTILGRALLRLALTEAACATVDLNELGTRDDGGPIIPEGFAGSISHTADAVGALACIGGMIGLDLEYRQHESGNALCRVPAEA